MKKITFILLFLLFTIPCQADTRDGLVGWWKFDEASGNAVDSSGQSHTGTVTGTTITATCARSGCRSFNGSSDLVEVTGSGYPDANGVQTLSAWIKLSNSSQDTDFFSYNDSINMATIRLYYNAGSVFASRVKQGVADQGAGIALTDLTGFHHIVGTFDGGTGTVFLDGVQKNTFSYSGGGLSATNDKFSIGASFNNGGTGQRFFAGSVDDSRIYNRVLTQADITALYQAGIQLRNAKINNAKFNY